MFNNQYACSLFSLHFVFKLCIRCVLYYIFFFNVIIITQYFSWENNINVVYERVIIADNEWGCRSQNYRWFWHYFWKKCSHTRIYCVTSHIFNPSSQNFDTPLHCVRSNVNSEQSLIAIPSFIIINFPFPTCALYSVYILKSLCISEYNNLTCYISKWRIRPTTFDYHM